MSIFISDILIFVFCFLLIESFIFHYTRNIILTYDGKTRGEESFEFDAPVIDLDSILEDFYYRKEIEQLIEKLDEKGKFDAVDSLVRLLWDKSPQRVVFYFGRKSAIRVNYVSPITVHDDSITVQAYDEDDPLNTYPVELSFYKEVLVHPI